MSGRGRSRRNQPKTNVAVSAEMLTGTGVVEFPNNSGLDSSSDNAEVTTTDSVVPSMVIRVEDEVNFGSGDDVLRHVAETDGEVEQADSGAGSPAAEPTELHAIFRSSTPSPEPACDNAFNEVGSEQGQDEEVTKSSLKQGDNMVPAAASEAELAVTDIYGTDTKSPFRQSLKLGATGPGRRLSAGPNMLFNQYTMQRSEAVVKIRSLMSLGEGTINTAMQNIAICLTTAINRGDLNWRPSDRKTLTENLRTLQFTSKSLFNTAINAVIATVLCCSLVGVVGLWLTGAFDKKKTVNGSAFAFFAFGEKQHAEKTIHQAELILQQAPAPAMS